MFALEGVGGGDAVFNTEKLEWMNSQHIMHTPTPELARRVEPLMKDAGLWKDEYAGARREWLCEVLELFKPRAKFLPEFVERGRLFFADVTSYDEAAQKKLWASPDTASNLSALADTLAAVEPFDVATHRSGGARPRRLPRRQGAGADAGDAPRRQRLIGEPGPLRDARFAGTRDRCRAAAARRRAREIEAEKGTAMDLREHDPREKSIPSPFQRLHRTRAPVHPCTGRPRAPRTVHLCTALVHPCTRAPLHYPTEALSPVRSSPPPTPRRSHSNTSRARPRFARASRRDSRPRPRTADSTDPGNIVSSTGTLTRLFGRQRDRALRDRAVLEEQRHLRRPREGRRVRHEDVCLLRSARRPIRPRPGPTSRPSSFRRVSCAPRASSGSATTSRARRRSARCWPTSRWSRPPRSAAARSSPSTEHRVAAVGGDAIVLRHHRAVACSRNSTSTSASCALGFAMSTKRSKKLAGRALREEPPRRRRGHARAVVPRGERLRRAARIHRALDDDGRAVGGAHHGRHLLGLEARRSRRHRA